MSLIKDLVKLVVAIFVCSILAKCSSDTAIVSESPTENIDTIVQSISPLMVGVWVTEDYILDIVKTKSPLKSSKYLEGACSIVIDSVLNLDSINAGVSWNNHEGSSVTIYNEIGHNNRFYKTNHIDYKNSENSYELGYEIDELDTQLVMIKYDIKQQVISTRKYVKVAQSQNNDDLGWGLQKVVNQVLIAGQRNITDSNGVSIDVIFTEDGEIRGNSDFDGFYIFTDFMGGPITVLDGICFKNGEESNCYAFESHEDTVFIYSTKGDPEPGSGEQEELDKLVYKIITIHDIAVLESSKLNTLFDYFQWVDSVPERITILDIDHNKEYPDSVCVPLSKITSLTNLIRPTGVSTTGIKPLCKIQLDPSVFLLIFSQQDDYGPLYYACEYDVEGDTLLSKEVIATNWGDAGDSQTIESTVSIKDGNLIIYKWVTTCEADIEAVDGEIVADEVSCSDSTSMIKYRKMDL
ncbi:MAG: hypothetical protein ACJAZ2_001369 [Glaciecola sp.]|jgi:hypothetical protein